MRTDVEAIKVYGIYYYCTVWNPRYSNVCGSILFEIWIYVTVGILTTVDNFMDYASLKVYYQLCVLCY